MYLNHGLSEDLNLIQITFEILNEIECRLKQSKFCCVAKAKRNIA